ncbi:MAG: 2,3-bisphosphoglycerate-dependent phosphoglycerate mutase [Leptospiraceae bacterium]|nr:2,3-bisphosphoglycerate-dependent phosphoglycerate mutase [Leptospiraceae bacterium]
MAELILVRHGESLWNHHNLFTGWVDIPLSKKGVEEALAAGSLLKDYEFDKIYTSTLIRAIMTALLIMTENKSRKVPLLLPLPQEDERIRNWARIYSDKAAANTIPIIRAWQLNERYYGELQGLNKDETKARYGEEQVRLWRRSYDVPPPGGEALVHTAERTIPYFKEEILPQLSSGHNILISAHGNSLRSIVMYLDGLTKEEVLSLEIKTGDPLRYRYENGKLTKEKSL